MTCGTLQIRLEPLVKVVGVCEGTSSGGEGGRDSLQTGECVAPLEEARGPWEWDCIASWGETLPRDVLLGAGW